MMFHNFMAWASLVVASASFATTNNPNWSVAATGRVLPTKNVYGVQVNCACDGRFSVGDRVSSVVDSPSGSTGLILGSQGTVVSGTDRASPVLLISWDNWTSGHNGNGYAGCPVTSLTDSSGWFVACNEVEPMAAQVDNEITGCIQKNGGSNTGAREAILQQPGVLTLVTPVGADSCFKFSNSAAGKPYTVSISGDLPLR